MAAGLGSPVALVHGSYERRAPRLPAPVAAHAPARAALRPLALDRRAATTPAKIATPDPAMLARRLLSRAQGAGAARWRAT